MPVMRLPFLYEVELVEPRGRKGHFHVVRDFADFAIDEVSPAEAPVATSHRRVEAHVRQGRASHPDGPETTLTRNHAGRTYRPVPVDGRTLSAAEFESLLGDFVAPHRRHLDLVQRYPVQTGFWRHHSDMLPTPGTLDLGHFVRSRSRAGIPPRIRSDDREARLAEAHALFGRSLLVVDGEVWSAQDAHEPRFEVVVPSDGSRVIEVRVGSHGDPPRAGAHVLSAGRRDDAVALCETLRRWHERQGRRWFSLVTRDSLDAVTPSVLLHDDCVTLAEQMLAQRGQWRTSFRSGGRTCEGRFAPSLRELDERFVALAQAGRHDLAWAAQVIAATEAIEASHDAVPGEYNEAAGVDRMRPLLMRWRTFERDRRPDVVDLMEGSSCDEEAVAQVVL